MSDRALAYLAEPMAHRFIILSETAAIEDSDIALALVRSLLSEGEIRYPTVEKDETGQLAATIKHLEGPTGLIMTTTAPRIHAENETRHLSINIPDDWGQTQTILHEQALLAAGKDVGHADIAPWHDFQHWLEGQERRVVVPFADQVAALVNIGPVRLRRDFPRFLALIMAHALLHQANRERDAAGRIVATLADYEAVHRLVEQDFAETAEMAHPKAIVEVAGGVRELAVSRPDGVTIHALIELAKTRKWGSSDRDVLTRRCRTAIARGLMVNLETKRGQIARYRLTAAACEEVGLFPETSQLTEKTRFSGAFDRSTSIGRATGRSQAFDEQGFSSAFDRSTSESARIQDEDGEQHPSGSDPDRVERQGSGDKVRQRECGEPDGDRAGDPPGEELAGNARAQAAIDPGDGTPLPGDLRSREPQRSAALRPPCAHCHKPVILSVADGGWTATSYGEYLHNYCIDEWIKA
jgi:hypothetical protein